MARSRHQDVTVREGTSKKYWYTVMAYVVALPLLAVYFAVTMNAGGAMAAAASGTMGILVLLGLAVVSIPAMFKDAAYLREIQSTWMPDWWTYLGASLGVPVVAYFGIDAVGLQNGGVMTMLAFVVTSYAASAYYMYNRHRYVGVP